MLKKCLAFILAIITIFAFNFLNNKPLFKKYADEFIVYVGEGGSLGKIIKVDYFGFLMQGRINGESCCFIDADFNLNDFFAEYNAKIVQVESTEDQVSYYAFSPQVKYSQRLFGKKVNLHVSVKKDRITVGSPLIYGSF
jgi:hypothetical protein